MVRYSELLSLVYIKVKAMDTQISREPDVKSSKELEGLVVKIIENIDVERIYLSKGTPEHSFTYRLNIIATLSRHDILEAIRPVIDTIFFNHKNFSYRIFSLSYANDELKQGNLYFLNHCHDKNIVYRVDQCQSIWNYPCDNLIKRAEKIKQDFNRDMSRMKSFKKGIHYYKTQDNQPQAAFMMHQTFEQGYRILERFVCGKIKICHSIKNHQSYVLKSLNKLEGRFQTELGSDNELLDLLEDAYSSARYTNSYNITKKDIEQLAQKLGLFIKEIKFWFSRELSVFKSNINHIEEKNLETSKHPNESEYFVRKFEFENSFEMLCMARSLMAVCATCLQDDVEPPMQINGFEYNINEVLQLAIELLPLRETSP